MSLSFSTKAGTLQTLSGCIKKAKILPMIRVFAREWMNGARFSVVKGIMETFSCRYLIVRSSAPNEDGLEKSNAGRFKSFLHVRKDDPKAIIKAIEGVFASYNEISPEAEVLVQPMLTNVKMAGVIFTADLETGAPYYIINYEESGSTTSITSGSSRAPQTFIHYKDAPFMPEDVHMARLVDTCRELEKTFNNPCLDIEFAFDDVDELYILQVRPLPASVVSRLPKDLYRELLAKLYKRLKRHCCPHPDLLGRKSIFGVMPDWNPAEMIGLKPRKLSLSLYKELITDNIWAYQRHKYGYRDLRSHPLLVCFLGIPYIDVRVDFNSFIPKNLHPNIAEKLVNYYIERLEAMPYLHDKIEFDVVFSCYYFGLPEKLKVLLQYGFNEYEIRRIEYALLDMTNRIIGEAGVFRDDLNRIEILQEKYKLICESDLSVLDKIYWLIENCKRYGTLPFAGIARAAFIAVQFLRSFINVGIFNQHDYARFTKSLNTIAKKFKEDTGKLIAGMMRKDEFLEQYGHLRPGTYDILSPTYRDAFDLYFSAVGSRYICHKSDEDEYKLSKDQLKLISSHIIENGLNIDAESLLHFIKEAIKSREYSKFIFTKCVSKMLSLIKELGERYGISPEELSHLDVRVIMDLYSSVDCRKIKDVLLENIERNRSMYNYTKALKLPVLVTRPEDVYSFYLTKEEPTFITTKRVRGEVIVEDKMFSHDLHGKIVFIRSADPGYDFLFSRGIGGLITQFGGANSHMAIRCAELGIPAVIGAGERNFGFWSKANFIEIDCETKNVIIIS